MTPECCCLPGIFRKHTMFVNFFVYKIEENPVIFSNLEPGATPGATPCAQSKLVLAYYVFLLWTSDPQLLKLPGSWAQLSALGCLGSFVWLDDGCLENRWPIVGFAAQTIPKSQYQKHYSVFLSEKSTTNQIVVNRGEWLWNSTKFFVICFCSHFWPWPYTKHNSCLLRTEELGTRENAVRMHVFPASGAYLPLKLYAITKQTRFRPRNSKK